MIQVENITGGYNPPVIKDVSFSVGKGEVFGILGPNGSGKTTLLHMINGTIPILDGNIYLDGNLLQNTPRRKRAERMAVLPQEQRTSFSFTVEQTVIMGRYPFQKGWFKQWSAEDEKIALQAMEQTGVDQFKNQEIRELSGGERQRVFLAQALTQQPDVLLLDEPTNHLDFRHQKQLLDSLKRWSIENHLTVVAIFHDLNLASLYCDRLLLLNHGQIQAIHSPKQVLKEQRLKDVYQSAIKVHANPYVSSPQVNVVPQSIPQQAPQTQWPDRIRIEDGAILFSVEDSLKVYSSGLVGAGFGWYKHFVNQHVDQHFLSEDPVAELQEFISQQGFSVEDSVGMMTAATLHDASISWVQEEEVSLMVVVTAGTSNAVDVVHGQQHTTPVSAGTVNTWVFIDGHLTEEAYIQAIVTATEAKTKAFQNQEIHDPLMGTIATGTSTDSILVGSTQVGRSFRYAGPITTLGSRIGKHVYHCTNEAIDNYKKRLAID